MKPLIIVNFKAYSQGTGRKAVELAKAIDKMSRSCHVFAIAAVQAPDIYPASSSVKLPVFAQHVDCNSFGSFTGSITPESIKAAGAKGTILNHAEKRITMQNIKESVRNCKKLGLKTLVCSDNLLQIKKILHLMPTYIAFEDPKLIGTGKSISRYRSSDVEKFSKLLEKTRTIPLCGAGVSNGDDVASALRLGTKGVLVSSAVVKSKNPASVLKDMMSA